VTLRTKKIAVFATCLGIGAAFPVISSADKGGVPHNQKPCPAKGKRHHKHSQPNTKGKKCGFAPGGTTSTTAPTAGTESTTTTTTTTTATP
jgi:hypothetical protein